MNRILLPTFYRMHTVFIHFDNIRTDTEFRRGNVRHSMNFRGNQRELWAMQFRSFCSSMENLSSHSGECFAGSPDTMPGLQGQINGKHVIHRQMKCHQDNGQGQKELVELRNTFLVNESDIGNHSQITNKPIIRKKYLTIHPI